MRANLGASQAGSRRLRPGYPESQHPRDRLASWSRRLAVTNLVFAAAMVLLWPGSLVALALGAGILAEILVLAVLYGLTRRSSR